MANYYNEFDPYAAEWLRNLIKEGLIPNGEVDTRSIVDVSPDDLRGFTQCHFFAGIAGWSLALKLAGWPDDREIWTGSCPCQPFSSAGKRKGKDDERHLWPHFLRLISACRPAVVMGEQVAGKAGYGWLDGVRSDLESESYACEGVDIPACAVNAPHIRQRLYWVASNLENAVSNGCQQQWSPEVSALQGKCSERRGKFSPAGLDGELSGRVEGFRGAFVWERPEYAANDKWWEREGAQQFSEMGNTNCSERKACDILSVGNESRPECASQSGLQSVADAECRGRKSGSVTITDSQTSVTSTNSWSH